MKTDFFLKKVIFYQKNHKQTHLLLVTKIYLHDFEIMENISEKFYLTIGIILFNYKIT